MLHQNIPPELHMRVEADGYRWGVTTYLQITDVSGIGFQSWMLASSPEKLKALAGEPFVVLFVRLSLVERYYLRHVNAWQPHDEVGYFCDPLPSAWQRRLEAVDKCLQGAGFKLFCEQANEEIPFIHGCGQSPDSDPRRDDSESEPSVPSCVYDCLFDDEPEP